MKKFFSLLAAVLFAGGIMADSYVKVTSAPADWAGQYLIVYEAGNVAFDGSLQTLDAVSNVINVEIANDEIAVSDATKAAEFTIAPVTGGYSVASASGFFIGQTSNANGLKQSAETAYVHELSIDDSGNAVMYIGGDVKVSMRFNKASNQNRFRYYKSGQEPVALYKLESGVAPAVAKPAIVATGHFIDEKEVSISCSTEGAAIYFTLDGTDPDAESKLYEAPFTLTETTIVKAIAILGEDASAIAEKEVVKAEVWTVSEAKAALDETTPLAGKYVAGIISQIDGYNSTYKSITYWISEDGSTDNQLEVYSGKGLNGADFAAETDLSVGDKVVIYGTLKIYNTIYEFDKTSEIVKYEAKDDPTAIDNTNVDAKAVKEPRNGQLFIMKGDKIYNVLGVEVR